MTIQILRLIMLLLVIAGCSKTPQVRGPTYTMQVSNRTGQDAYPVDVTYGGMPLTFGASVVNGNKSDVGIPTKLPGEVTVRWTTEDGKKYEKTLATPPAPEDRSKDVTILVMLFPEGEAQIDLLDEKAERAKSILECKECLMGWNGGPKYFIAEKNASGHELMDLKVLFGNFIVGGAHYFAAKDLTENWHFTAPGIPYPITDKALVKWKDPEGKAHIQEVNLKNQLPKKMDGIVIVFIIHKDDTVTVQTMTEPEWKIWNKKQ
jgi:hypothetical protein